MKKRQDLNVGLFVKLNKDFLLTTIINSSIIIDIVRKNLMALSLYRLDIYDLKSLFPSNRTKYKVI